MKAKGFEIRDFWINYWPKNLSDWYYESDDGTIDVEDEDGNYILEDTKIYNLKEFGPLGWQGQGDCPVEFGYWEFEDAFKKYKKTITLHLQFITDIPKEEKELFLKAIEDHKNWKIIN
jgi:hypothetical protein